MNTTQITGIPKNTIRLSCKTGDKLIVELLKTESKVIIIMKVIGAITIAVTYNSARATMLESLFLSCSRFNDRRFLVSKAKRFFISPLVFDMLLMLTMSFEKISDALRASMSLSEDTTSYPSIL